MKKANNNNKNNNSFAPHRPARQFLYGEMFVHGSIPWTVQTVFVGHLCWKQFVTHCSFQFHSNFLCGGEKQVSRLCGSVSTNIHKCSHLCSNLSAVSVVRIISGVELREGYLSFHYTTACRYNLATFSLKHFVSRNCNCPVYSASPFRLRSLFHEPLTEQIPRHRVWDEQVCMCVLAWLTRWECLAVFLPSNICVCVCVCQTGCVSE